MWLSNSVEFEPVNSDSETGFPVALYFSKPKRFLSKYIPCRLEVLNGTISFPVIFMVKLNRRFKCFTEFESSLGVLLFPTMNFL